MSPDMTALFPYRVLLLLLTQAYPPTLPPHLSSQPHTASSRCVAGTLTVPKPSPRPIQLLFFNLPPIIDPVLGLLSLAGKHCTTLLIGVGKFLVADHTLLKAAGHSSFAVSWSSLFHFTQHHFISFPLPAYSCPATSHLHNLTATQRNTSSSRSIHSCRCVPFTHPLFPPSCPVRPLPVPATGPVSSHPHRDQTSQLWFCSFEY